MSAATSASIVRFYQFWPSYSFDIAIHTVILMLYWTNNRNIPVILLFGQELQSPRVQQLELHLPELHLRLHLVNFFLFNKYRLITMLG